jgi:osmotically-inducible protein OsmY
MIQTPLKKTISSEKYRCEESGPQPPNGKNGSDLTQKSDKELKEKIHEALWKDVVIRALEYSEIDLRVKNGEVYLFGHIISTTNQSRILYILNGFPGILGIYNHLVLDDQLTGKVASSLANLEHEHGCKFYTGASHGVVSLNGMVVSAEVKSMAEKSAAGIPGVRGVVNNIQVSGNTLKTKDQPFLQPAIGESIYFLDGASGVVQQVVINPNNRRVVAMTISLPALNEEPFSQPLLVVRMSTVRHLTRVSGFLHINSDERKQCKNFDPTAFVSPEENWVPPYPYCAFNVIFPIQRLAQNDQMVSEPELSLVSPAVERQISGEQPNNDSLGG